MAQRSWMKSLAGAALAAAAALALSGCPARRAQAEQKTCEKDDDCGLVTTACTCMVCDDDAPVDAVNKAQVAAFDFHQRATESERVDCVNKCKTAGACVPHKKPTATCVAKLCTVTWVPALPGVTTP